ncbi:hypothetical protein D3C71_131630 [compost metagenome]
MLMNEQMINILYYTSDLYGPSCIKPNMKSMSKSIILAMCMPFLAACTNESEKNHDMMIKKYFKAASSNGADLQIRRINTHSQKHTAYTSFIEYQYINKEGKTVKSSVTIETVGTNQNYIVVNGDCISTDQLAYELKNNIDPAPASQTNSGNSRREMDGKYMKNTPEYVPFR